MAAYNTSLDKVSFPMQKLPISQKTKDWKEKSLNAVIAREGGGMIGRSTRREIMRTAYGLYNSDYNEEDLKYVTNPFKVEDGFPAKTQNFNVIRPKIDLLIGEETKRPFNIRVIQTNDNIVSRLQEKKKQLLLQYASTVLGMDDGSGIDISPEEIEKYMRKTYKTIAEETAYNSLNYLKESLNLDNEFIKGWRDGLIAGEEIYYVGIINGEPVLERVNPLYCDYDKDPDLEFIEDGDWFVRRMKMSPAAIYDRFFDIMTEKDLDALLDYSMGKATTGRADQVNTRSVMYKESISDRFFSSETDERSLNLINVWHGVWRSYKKVGFLTLEEGEVTMVSEDYKPLPDEQVEWDWVPEIWEGYRIGEDIYVGIGPVEYQHVSIDNPANRKLPYCGVIYSNINSRSKSLVSIMKPLQYMYIILWYRLELALARDKGKIINMDITQIPKGIGIDVNQWMHYLTSIGVNFFNPYDEGWDIPGREGGKPSPFNQFTQVDLTMANVINEYIQLMAKIEEMIGEISGVSKARQGQIHERSLVGNVEREVIQSSHITEPLFWNHGQAKRNSLTMLLDTAKHAWSESAPKKIHYLLDDMSRVFLEIDEDFLYSDFAVFVSDSTKEVMDIEQIKTLLQPAMQNGASLLDAAEILSSENLSEIKSKLEEIEKRREEMMMAQQQAEQAVSEQELVLKQEELRIKEEDSIRDAETSIIVAEIGAGSKEGGSIEDNSAQLQLQREKMQKDAELKDKQIKEDIRSNKVAEKQKQQEIAIKRKQANKPNSTTSKSK